MSGGNINDFRIVSPFDKAPFLSKLLFLWILPQIRGTKSTELSEETLAALPAHYQIEDGVEVLQRAWQGEAKKEKPSFLSALLRAFGWRFVSACVPLQLSLFAQLGVALVISELIGWLRSPNEDAWRGFGLACLLLLYSATASVLQNKTNINFSFLGGLIKQAGMLTVFQKSLRLSMESQQKAGAGKLVNLVSADLDMFEDLVSAGTVLCLPLYLIAAAGLLYCKLEWSGLLATAITILQVPVQRASSSFLTRIRRSTAEATDSRLKLLSNVIEGIKLIKLYAWEEPLIQLIERTRAKEIDVIKKRFILKAIHTTLGTCGHGVTLLFTFWVYSALGNTFQLAAQMGAMTIIMSMQFYVCTWGSGAVDLITIYKAHRRG